MCSVRCSGDVFTHFSSPCLAPPGISLTERKKATCSPSLHLLHYSGFRCFSSIEGVYINCLEFLPYSKQKFGIFYVLIKEIRGQSKKAHRKPSQGRSLIARHSTIHQATCRIKNAEIFHTKWAFNERPCFIYVKLLVLSIFLTNCVFRIICPINYNFSER